MTVHVDALSIRVQFQSGPGETPSEVWTLTSEPDGFELSEQALDESLFEFAREAGSQSTFMLSRRYSTGGWGASGLSAMDVVIAIGLNVLSNAAYDALVALYKKFAGREPSVSREAPSQLAAPVARKGRSKKKSTRKRKPKH